MYVKLMPFFTAPVKESVLDVNYEAASEFEVRDR